MRSSSYTPSSSNRKFSAPAEDSTNKSSDTKSSARSSLSISEHSFLAPPIQARMPVRLETDNEIFSFYIDTQINMTGYLSTEVGDLVVVLHSNKNTAQEVLARNEGQLFVNSSTVMTLKTGLINTDQLQLNIHSPNKYLRVMDVVLDHPSLLPTLLRIEKINGLEDHRKKLVTLLCARGILSKSLIKLLELEFAKKKGLETKGDLLREESDAVRLIVEILKPSMSLNTFSESFDQYLCDTINTKAKDNKFKKDKPLAKILEIIIRYFDTKLRLDEMPPELIMVMKCINDTAIKHGMMDEKSRLPLVATALYLRFICPLITSSAKLEKTLRAYFKNDSVNRIAITKGLLSITNREDPQKNPTNNKTLFPIIKDIHDLYEPAASGIRKIVNFPIRNFSVEIKRERTAASYYWLVNHILTKTEAEFSSNLIWIDRLKSILGEPPPGPLTDGDAIPLAKEIEYATDFIKHLSRVSPSHGIK